MTGSTDFAVIRSTRLSRATWLAGTAALAALAAAPWWAEPSILRSIGQFAYLVAIAQMWNLLAGYGGLISVGQHAFIGIGGYTMLALSLNAGVSPFACVPLAGIAAAAIAVPVAVLMFRLTGPYFAIGTWVVADVFRLVLANMPSIGGGSGRSLTSALIGIPAWQREAATYWIALALGVGLTLALYFFLRSRHGLALTAIRDNVAASESLGVKVVPLKLMVFVASAAGLGMAGALIYVTKLRISPDAAFSVDWTALMIFIVVIGGIGTIEGPIVGTAIYYLMRSALADFGPWYMVVLGATAILVMRKARRGVWPLLAERFDLHLFPVRRRLALEPRAAEEVRVAVEAGACDASV